MVRSSLCAIIVFCLTSAHSFASLGYQGRAGTEDLVQFRADSTLLRIPVTVRDSEGRVIPKLKPSDFRVQIDGAKVGVQAVEPSLGLAEVSIVFDQSTSMSEPMEKYKAGVLTAEIITNNLIGPKRSKELEKRDCRLETVGSITGVDTSFNLAADCSYRSRFEFLLTGIATRPTNTVRVGSSFEEAQYVLRQMTPYPLGRSGGTALYDSIGAALSHFSKPRQQRMTTTEKLSDIPRRFILVISDGMDTESTRFTLQDVERLARKLEVPIYVVFLSETAAQKFSSINLWDISSRVKMAINGKGRLENLARNSGGRFFSFVPSGDVSNWYEDAHSVALALVSEIYWSYEVTVAVPTEIVERRGIKSVSVYADQKAVEQSALSVFDNRPPPQVGDPESPQTVGIFNSDGRLVDYARPRKKKSPIRLQRGELSEPPKSFEAGFVPCRQCSVGAPAQIDLTRNTPN